MDKYSMLDKSRVKKEIKEILSICENNQIYVDDVDNLATIIGLIKKYPRLSIKRKFKKRFEKIKVKKIIPFKNKLKNLFRRSILLFLLFLLKTLNARIVDINTISIGHMLGDSDTFIKEQALNLIKKKKYNFLLINKKRLANKYALNYLKKHFIIIKNKYLSNGRFALFCKNTNIDFGDLIYETEHYTSAINKTAHVFRINELWNKNTDRQNIFELSSAEEEAGHINFKKLGLDKFDWFVCLHVRDNVYDPETHHDFRNSDINIYKKAIEYISSMGGVCVRFGRDMKNIDNNLIESGLIDYVNSDVNSDFMDFYLSSKCKFFIGNASGPSSFALFFNKPLLTVNVAPLACCPHWNFGDISIPKFYYCRERQRILTFREIFENGFANYRYFGEFEKSKITLIDNDDIDILNATMEMYEKISGNWILELKDEKNQSKFKSYFKYGDYSFGSQSSISDAFLRRHKFLLID